MIFDFPLEFPSKVLRLEFQMKTKETETFHEFRQEVKIPRKSRKALESETRTLPQSDTCEPVEACSGAFWVNYMKTMKGRMENSQHATQKERNFERKNQFIKGER